MNDSYIIRKLSKADEKQLNSLIREVESGLKKETFWLPITEISRMHFFDDTWTYFLGVFNNEEELIGAVALFFNENECFEVKHTAYSRSIFAEGALKAAEFIVKQHIGYYNNIE